MEFWFKMEHTWQLPSLPRDPMQMWLATMSSSVNWGCLAMAFLQADTLRGLVLASCRMLGDPVDPEKTQLADTEACFFSTNILRQHRWHFLCKLRHHKCNEKYLWGKTCYFKNKLTNSKTSFDRFSFIWLPDVRRDNDGMTLCINSFHIYFWYQYVFNVHWWHNKLTNLSISPPSDDTVRSNKISSISIRQCNGVNKGVGHVNRRIESQDAHISFIQTSSFSIAWVLQRRHNDPIILLFKKEKAFIKVAFLWSLTFRVLFP